MIAVWALVAFIGTIVAWNALLKRNIGESMIAAQAEWRWQATPRLGFVAFGGTGKVSGALGQIDTGAWLPAGGVGVRFRLVKALPLNMRADFAWGRDDSTFSLAVGEAF